MNAILGMIFGCFLAVVLIVCCLRAGKLVIKMLNGIFDKLEEHF